MSAKPLSMRRSGDPLDLKVETEATATTDMKKGGSDWILRTYMSEIGQTKLLGPEEEREIARRARMGDETARELMIKANLRLVIEIAKDYIGSKLSLLDLISEGNIGLMKAVERYDPDHGSEAKFSTYASWKIKGAIKRALSRQSRTIRLPEHVITLMNHIHETSTRLRAELEREPSDEEIAEEIGLRTIDIQRNRMAMHGMVSIDMSRDRDYDASMEQFIPDENAVMPSKNLELETALGQLEVLISKLLPREQEILHRHFGLSGRNPETLDSIGETFGISRSRVGQVVETALKKLRDMYGGLKSKALLRRLLHQPNSEWKNDPSLP